MSDQRNSRHQGDNQRRRRNRGGQRNKQNRNQQGHQQQHEASEFSPSRDAGGGRNRQRQQGAGGRPGRRPPPPPKLTWWQKLLQFFGLYKSPARPQADRPQQPVATAISAPATPIPAKSNVRNLRSGDESTAARAPKPSAEKPERERTAGKAEAVETPRVYVGNLSYDVTEEDLKELFRGIGGVRHVEIVYNRNTHRSKGYGFVEMLHVDEARRAVEVLHDQFFMGRQMTVSGAQSRGQDEREDREEATARPPRSDRPERSERPDRSERTDRSERSERSERRPRQDRGPGQGAAVAAAGAAAATLTEDALGDSGEIATIIETTEPSGAAPAAAAPAEVPVAEAGPAAVEPWGFAEPVVVAEPAEPTAAEEVAVEAPPAETGAEASQPEAEAPAEAPAAEDQDSAARP